MPLVPISMGGGGQGFPLKEPYLSGSEGRVTESNIPSNGIVEAEEIIIGEGASVTAQDTLYLFATKKIEIKANATINGKGNGSNGGYGGYGTEDPGEKGKEGMMGGAGGDGGSGGWASAFRADYDDGGRGGDGGNTRSVSANKLAAYYSMAVSSSFTTLPSLGGAGGGGGGGGGASWSSGQAGGDGGNGGAGLLLCAPEIVVAPSAMIDLRGQDGEDGESAGDQIEANSGAGGGGGGGGGDCAAVGETVTLPDGVVKQSGGSPGQGGDEGYPEGSSDGNRGNWGNSGELIVP